MAKKSAREKSEFESRMAALIAAVPRSLRSMAGEALRGGVTTKKGVRDLLKDAKAVLRSAKDREAAVDAIVAFTRYPENNIYQRDSHRIFRQSRGNKQFPPRPNAHPDLKWRVQNAVWLAKPLHERIWIVRRREFLAAVSASKLKDVSSGGIEWSLTFNLAPGEAPTFLVDSRAKWDVYGGKFRKFPGLAITNEVTLPRDWRTQVRRFGRAHIDGTVILSAELIERRGENEGDITPGVYRLTVARPKRGFDVGLEILHVTLWPEQRSLSSLPTPVLRVYKHRNVETALRHSAPDGAIKLAELRELARIEASAKEVRDMEALSDLDGSHAEWSQHLIQTIRGRLTA